ncbi:hypothetical protein [Burkholderia sp. BCC1977]|uniref:hypothetical protein n=1 Tax=Burkholderia sp. BCC1977 TaxID=2817440 RepID=UPI002ABDD019|nr:hypothetical protein [Burkholderia sp. BCC1977]
MKWMTRGRPKVDRIACPREIAGFIDDAPESAALYAMPIGLSANFADDHAPLRHGMVKYDALDAGCRRDAPI